VQRPVEAHLAQVEPDGPVEGGHRLGLELVEHPDGDPLVTSSPQRRVRHLAIQDRFDVDPRGPGDQSDQGGCGTGRDHLLERRPWELAGHLHIPAGASPSPGLVFTGPLTGVKEQVTGRYAEALAGAGYVTLAFDQLTPPQ
jgi:hypothetical protein